MNKKLIIMLSVAVIIAMAVTAFPLHIEPSHNSDWPFVITIGSPVSAQEADYTCDGADDNVQFQTALNALPSSGGQLFVLAGNYTFADSTTVTRAIDHVSIIGVSAAVSFTGDGVTAIFTAGGNGWLFSNIEVDSGEIDMGATTDYMWLHVISNDTYYPLKTDAINIEDHSSLHGVGGADTLFPADPDADKFLKWDDDPGELVWSDAGAGDGDMQKATYDQDEDGDIDTAAGGTEWDSSAATGVAYITAGAWGTRATGISNTFVVIVDDADAANGDIPYFTNDGLAGYNEAEFKTAYNMEAGTDYQAYDAELAALAGLTSAENKVIYFTGSETADVADFTAFARTILDDADEATFKATVNLEIGTDVQAQDATLSSIADLGTASNKIAYTTDVDTWAEAGITAFALSIFDDADEATFKATTNLEIGTDVLAQQTIGIADDNLLEVDGAPNDDEYARFTANGLEGRTEAEFKADFNLEVGTDIISKSTFDTHDAATTGVHGVGTDYICAAESSGTVAQDFVEGWADGWQLLGDGVDSDPIEIMGMDFGQPWAYECWLVDPEDAASMWDVEASGGEIYTKGVTNMRLRTNAVADQYIRIYSDNIPGGTYTNSVFSILLQMGGDVSNRDIYAGVWEGGTARRPALTAEHFGFKIIDGDVYATIADGATEEAEDTGVDVSAYNNIGLLVQRDSAGVFYFYVNGVLTNDMSTNSPLFSTSLVYFDIETDENDNKAMYVKTVAFKLFNN